MYVLRIFKTSKKKRKDQSEYVLQIRRKTRGIV